VTAGATLSGIFVIADKRGDMDAREQLKRDEEARAKNLLK
jgi:hypothetical protein